MHVCSKGTNVSLGVDYKENSTVFAKSDQTEPGLDGRIFKRRNLFATASHSSQEVFHSELPSIPSMSKTQKKEREAAQEPTFVVPSGGRSPSVRQWNAMGVPKYIVGVVDFLDSLKFRQVSTIYAIHRMLQ